MATSLSEFAAGLGSKPLAEYPWWKHHAAFFISLFLAVPMVLTLYFGLSPLWSYLGVYGLLEPAVNWILRGLFAVVGVTAVGSWIGYYFDAKYIETLDVDWSPRWGIYMALHVTIFIGGPLFAVPVYVIQRMRHVGLPIFG